MTIGGHVAQDRDGSCVSSRQGLQDIDFVARSDGIGEMRAIGDRLSVDEDVDVLAQHALLVDDIAAQARLQRKTASRAARTVAPSTSTAASFM